VAVSALACFYIAIFSYKWLSPAESFSLRRVVALAIESQALSNALQLGAMPRARLAEHSLYGLAHRHPALPSARRSMIMMHSSAPVGWLGMPQGSHGPGPASAFIWPAVGVRSGSVA
jgi:hypothetical protein